MERASTDRLSAAVETDQSRTHHLKISTVMPPRTPSSERNPFYITITRHSTSPQANPTARVLDLSNSDGEEESSSNDEQSSQPHFRRYGFQSRKSFRRSRCLGQSGCEKGRLILTDTMHTNACQVFQLVAVRESVLGLQAMAVTTASRTLRVSASLSVGQAQALKSLKLQLLQDARQCRFGPDRRNARCSRVPSPLMKHKP